MHSQKHVFLLVLLFLAGRAFSMDSKPWAYVTMYYPGGSMSRADSIAVRTMYASFKSVESKADFLVVVPLNVPLSIKSVFINDGMQVQEMDMVNPYRSHTYPADYQKALNLVVLWKLTQYERVIFLDPFSVFVKNMDGLFKCYFLCVKDEQPLVYSNDAMVITPGHVPTQELVESTMKSQATLDQYLKFDKSGYYSPELYEHSLSAPLWWESAPDMPTQQLRRFYIYYCFPSIMWYEKFNWHLYSCSGINDTLPVYTINYRYQIGKKWYFLPVNWQGHNLVWLLHTHWLGWRETLHESYRSQLFWSFVLLSTIGVLSPILYKCITFMLNSIYVRYSSRILKLQSPTGLVKLIVSFVVAIIWLVPLNFVPSTLHPRYAFAIAMICISFLCSIVIYALNKSATQLMGVYRSPIYNVSEIVIFSILLYGLIYSPLWDRITVLYRGCFFIGYYITQVYCIYTQISSLFYKEEQNYFALPE